MADVTAVDTAQPSQCWCCGERYPEAELHRLGSHPEVGVCTDCARWLYRRATQRHHEQRRSVSAPLRRLIGSVRGAVIARGLHDRRLIGPALRWIDRFLP
jgi:hypothetical protein